MLCLVAHFVWLDAKDFIAVDFFFTCDKYKIYQNVSFDVLVQCFEGQSMVGNGS